MSIDAVRRDYVGNVLLEEALPANPLELFEDWLLLAESQIGQDALAMHLATVDERGAPTVRVVLLRGLDDQGLRFYTCLDSAKSQQLKNNTAAAISFYWAPFDRHVRVSGEVVALPVGEIERYFRSRPRPSQLAAHASRQSSVITDRVSLERSFAEVEQRFMGQEVPVPERWGGYVLVPQRMEFWQGRPSRLHDRIEYQVTGQGKDGAQEWKSHRLAP
jgi:pyridoxamine 5'-phosphate oxidase